MTIPVQIIKPSGQDDVAPHEHDATEISGVYNFLRALKVIIQGDIKSDNWDGLSQVPGSGATVGFFLDGSSGNAEFVDFFANAAGIDELTLNAQDGVNEGGQVAFQGAGSFSTALVNDRFQDTWRVIIGPNAPLQVSDSNTIILVGGTEVGRFNADGLVTGPLGVLGYASTSSSQTGISSITDLTGLSVTVTAAANRRIRITGHVRVRQRTGAGIAVGYIREGSTNLGSYGIHELQTNEIDFLEGSAIVTPSSGSHTYKLSLETTANTVDTQADTTTNLAFILVEDMGPA